MIKEKLIRLLQNYFEGKVGFDDLHQALQTLSSQDDSILQAINAYPADRARIKFSGLLADEFKLNLNNHLAVLTRDDQSPQNFNKIFTTIYYMVLKYNTNLSKINQASTMEDSKDQREEEVEISPPAKKVRFSDRKDGQESSLDQPLSFGSGSGGVMTAEDKGVSVEQLHVTENEAVEEEEDITNHVEALMGGYSHDTSHCDGC